MTDDNKENRFNSVVRWLKESGFTIAEEKHTIVTSEFFAKVFPLEKPFPAVELSSSPSLGNGILFQIVLSDLQKLVPNFNLTVLRNKVELDELVKEKLRSNETFLLNNDSEIMIQKVLTFDPQRMESKFEILALVNNLLTLATDINGWISSELAK